MMDIFKESFPGPSLINVLATLEKFWKRVL